MLPKFISNFPVGIDLFESNAQAKVTAAVANYIKNNNPPSKLIGVEGAWGTGKSNVVVMIGKCLADTHHLFIFDTWVHQEDLQRRSFLEELTANLIKHKIIDEGRWKEKLQNLLSKKRTTHTKNVPKLSAPILVAVLLAILSPIVKEYKDDIPEKYELIRLLFVFSPLIIAVISYLIFAAINKSLNISDLFYVFKEKEVEAVVTESISEMEPSVTEFRKWMRELSADANRHLITVFDNTDRLPIAKLQVVWSSIHTFYTEAEYDKIWALVPFDRHQLQLAFNQGEGDISSYIVEKTFPVTFSIAPPVMSDWTRFFHNKFNEAFNGEANSEVQFVAKLFDLYNNEITPRKIIAFINQLVSLELLWRQEIPLRFGALFLLNRERILKDPIKEILDTGFASKAKYLFKNDAELYDWIAALTFNIPVAEATQVTIYREMLIALRENNISRLEILVKYPRFIEVLDRLIERETDLSVTTLVPAIHTAQNLMPNNEHGNVFDHMWRSIVYRFYDEEMEIAEFTEIHRILIYKCAEGQLPDLLVALYQKFFHLCDPQSGGRRFYQVISKMEECVKQLYPEVVMNYVRSNSVEPSFYYDFVEEAGERYSDFKMFVSNQTLDYYLSEMFNTKVVNMSRFAALDDEKFKFPILQGTIEQKLQTLGKEQNELVPLMLVYKRLEKERPIRIKIPEFQMQHLLANSIDQDTNHPELLAIAIGQLQYFQQTNGIDNHFNKLDGENLIEKVAKYVEDYMTYGQLLLCASEGNIKAYGSLARQLTLEPVGASEVEIFAVLSVYERILENVRVAPKDLITRLSQIMGNRTGDITSESMANILTPKLLQDCLMLEQNQLAAFVVRKTKEYFFQLPEKDWRETVLGKMSDRFRILILLVEANKIQTLPENAVRPFIEKLEDAKTNLYSDTFNHYEDWHKLYNCVESRKVKTLMKNLLDHFLTSNEIAVPHFQLYEPMLRRDGDLKRLNGEVVRKLLIPMLEDVDCLLLISENMTFYAPLIIDAKEDGLHVVAIMRNHVEGGGQIAAVKEILRSLHALLSRQVRISHAEYGIEANVIDVTATITSRVRRGDLHFKIGNDLVKFDPVHGIRKTLTVEFEYDGKTETTIFTEHEWFRIP